MVVNDEKKDALTMATLTNTVSAVGPLATTSDALPREVDAPTILGHALRWTLRVGRQLLAKAENPDKAAKRQ